MALPEWAADATNDEDALGGDADPGDEVEHELVLTTRENWEAYCRRPRPLRPPVLAPDVLAGLTDGEKRVYDRARLAYFASGMLVQHAQAERVEDEIRTLLLRNRGEPTARSGLIVSGPSGMGKTTTLALFAKRHQAARVKRHPDLAGSNGFLPVVYFTIPSKPGSKAVALSIANFVNWPYKDSDSETMITTGVTNVLRRCRTSLVIVDEYHFLLRTALRTGRRTRAVVEADNFIKGLQDSVPATFVLLGIDLDDLGSQTEGRFKSIRYAPYDYDEDWASVCKAFEEKLVLLRHPEFLLTTALVAYLHARTGGRVGSLSALIREAGIRAVRDGTERIDLAALRRVSIDKTAEDHWANLDGRRQLEADAEAAQESYLSEDPPLRGQIEA